MIFFNDVLINLTMIAAIKKAETKDPTLEKRYGIILISGAGQILTEFLYSTPEERDAEFNILINMVKDTDIYKTLKGDQNGSNMLN